MTKTLEKAKPGPKPDTMRTVAACPFCGGKAHRKAVQHIKGAGAYRRMYCADGCGHYHYRDVETDMVVDVGQGPRECRLHRVNQVNVVPFEEKIAKDLGIDTSNLWFTAKNDSGRPRALVNCLSQADIAMLTPEEGETIKYLHEALLTVQACIGVFRKRAEVATRLVKVGK